MNQLNAEQREAVALEFRRAMRCATDLFGDHAFREWRGGKGNSPINKALFETVAVNLATLDDHEREALVASSDRVLSGFFGLVKDVGLRPRHLLRHRRHEEATHEVRRDGGVLPGVEGMCWFTDDDGTQQLFDRHSEFLPKPGRTHFRLLRGRRALRVAYVGRKVDV
ncbi:hypothetical protein [Streptomyces sp. H27-C3]|uniref:hypothetical protein n=1 Tax=Streptomyces sp. H27-C3 TaxID=3046305 RepID=UPI0024B947E8|nr:hypothetical protein [Streptomyces sp. H27-C3]MDJ0465366.1 hypothetical protein [Streptomyces sp. H27-C3]